MTSVHGNYLLTEHFERTEHRRENLIFKCSMCDFSAKTRNIVNQHKKIHTPRSESVKLYCNTCGLKVSNQGKLDRHLTTHSDQRNFSCDICKRKYKNTTTRDGHKLNVHDQTPKMYPVHLFNQNSIAILRIYK